MSDFVDNEAEESDLSSEEGELSDGELRPVKKGKKEKEKPKKKKAIQISDDEEEEDEDEAAIAEEMKDFINEDVEEDAEEEEEGEGSDQDEKKRKKHHRSDDEDDDQLDDEDFDLIDDNLGIKINRKHKRKRIKMMSDDEDSDKEEDGQADDGKHAIEEQLFDEDDAEDGEGPAASVRDEQEVTQPQDFDSEEESDVDDFIVDEEGNSISKGKKKKKHKIHSDAALQEAQEIFGVDFDFAEFDKYDEDEEDFEEEDEYEEDEEGEDGETRRSKKGKKKATKKSIFDVFEPSELETGHFTDADNVIRSADLPERFQLRRVPVKSAADAELEEEAKWIYKQAFATPCISQQSYLDMDHMGATNNFSRRAPNMMTSKIKQALDFMRNQGLEVPFIAFYRKEYVEPELNINDLWRVYHWDEKWMQLCTRRSNLTRLHEKMKDYLYEQYSDPDKPAVLFRPISEEEIERVKNVQTPEELRDVYQNFLLYYGHEIPNMRNNEQNQPREEGEAEREPKAKGNSVKQASRRSGYSICLGAKLDEITRQFGLKPHEFGENIRDNYQRHDVSQCPLEPLELAKDYVCPQFPSEEDVLKGCQHMVAMQLSQDPLVRQSVRTAFQERAKIRVQSTKKGLKVIDESHNCFTVKYLRGKPVKDLKDDQYLKLNNAEEEGLITISVKMDEEEEQGGTISTYFEEIRQLYYRDEFSHLVQQWNTQRSEALKRALYKILYPQMEKELRAKLLQEAKEGVLKACARKLYNWLKVAPYQMDQQLEDEFDEANNEDGLKVLGIAFSTSMDTPAFGALIDGDASVMEFIRLENITKRKNAWRELDKKGKEKDIEKLKEFIAEKKPHVIAVTSESRQALMIIDDIKAIISELEMEQQMPAINVELVDNELAMIFENTKRAETEFREYPAPLRHAISIARRLQDPLLEFAQLCNGEEDILCMRYHTLQDSLPKEELLESLYLEFVNRVNEVGVDINQVLSFPYTAPLLQFVCGLGPRKSAQLIKTLKQNNSRLENRTQLVQLCHMGPKVFINCGGFITIDTNQLGDTSEVFVDVLDGSRVHPEAYEWARKMAVDALEYDDTAEDANPASALEEILESPERLKDLDLDAFAEELERQGYGDKHITLYDIRAELNHRYKDLRTPYRSPSLEERFNMLTKETPETFYVGKMVLVRVTGIAHKRPQGDQLDQANPVRDEVSGLWQCPFCHSNQFPELSDVWSHFDGGNCPGAAVGVKCRLDSGVTGFIHTKNISDKMIRDPEERVQIGMTIHSRITKIDIERFQVELTSKSSDLSDKDGLWRPQKDVYYDYDQEKLDIDKENDKKKLQARQTYIKRVIAHPYFHNVSYKECEKLLANMDQGDVIVRPSSKGSDHLTATWKVADGILQHVDIREEGKENAFSLGRCLWIGTEEYEDLDEIIARHIQPMAATVRDLMAFKYYRDSEGGKREILDKLLAEEKKKTGFRIPYLMSASRQYPGKFLLSYMPRNVPRHEYVSVTPDGMRYRLQMFSSVNSLIRWFKEHFRDPIPGTPAGRTPAMSTYTTPGQQMQTPGRTPVGRTPMGMSSGMYGHHSTTPRGAPSATPQMGGRSAYGGFGSSMPYQPGVTPMMNSMMTPSSSYQQSGTGHMTTPGASGQMGTATPSYQPTPRSMGGQGAPWPGATPRTPASRTPRMGQQTPSGHHHHHQQQQRTPRQSSGPTTSSGDMDWARAAELWANRKKNKSPRASPRPSPLPSPARRGLESPFTTGSNAGGASPQGDGTPLIDER
ncbi:transcription elongation factor SPT6 isoform X2 [Aplysia californica]|uniref:Transcription elongation factor SPT6 isoform X2 n=1 Tax=Aplysia californica TaxID=6500 RepID=A0ABM0JAH0_APLCA|nr:transcription elongation factor SPT6 isoform X2 [Aplysia californica]